AFALFRRFASKLGRSVVRRQARRLLHIVGRPSRLSPAARLIEGVVRRLSYGAGVVQGVVPVQAGVSESVRLVLACGRLAIGRLGNSRQARPRGATIKGRGEKPP